MKRIVDFIVSSLALIIFSPIIGITALLIQLEIGSPVLFKQQRPGLNGAPFYVYKFRTMTDERDEHGELLPDEIRLTSFGKLVRKSSFDELPQLWNVLKGDMSFVGPRPLLMEYLLLYNDSQARRHEVRPGITGWAQVNGRNEVSWEEKFDLDIWYVENRSFWLDIQILFMTVLKVFKSEGISQDGHATMPKFKEEIIIRNNEFTILFTSSGRRVSLIKHFKDLLSELNIHGKVITTDVKNTSPAGFISDEHLVVPQVTSSDYITTILNICEKFEVSLIVPLIDPELEILANHKKQFEDMGIKLLVSSKETIEICFDKRNTATFFREVGLDTPYEYKIDEIMLQGTLENPLLIKPAKGSSSVGVNVIHSLEELAFFSKHIKEPILQELVIGEEYTIDVLSDFNGVPITAVPRLRMETRAGEVSKGMTVRNPLLIEKSMEMVRKLPGAVGCITIQCFLTESNEVKFIEINPRFGGGFPLSVQAGADFPRYIIESMLGIESKLNVDEWDDGLVMLRYDDAIFVQKDQIT